MSVPPFQADPDGPTYVYLQVADHIAARVAAGDLVPGQRLPAERDLAMEYGVAYLTIRRAMRELRDRGLVITVPAKGNFIQSSTPEGTDEDTEA